MAAENDHTRFTTTIDHRQLAIERELRLAARNSNHSDFSKQHSNYTTSNTTSNTISNTISNTDQTSTTTRIDRCCIQHQEMLIRIASRVRDFFDRVTNLDSVCLVIKQIEFPFKLSENIDLEISTFTQQLLSPLTTIIQGIVYTISLTIQELLVENYECNVYPNDACKSLFKKNIVNIIQRSTSELMINPIKTRVDNYLHNLVQMYNYNGQSANTPDIIQWRSTWHQLTQIYRQLFACLPEVQVDITMDTSQDEHFASMIAAYLDE